MLILFTPVSRVADNRGEQLPFGKLFINSISCVISQGIKAAYSMWKEGAKAIERTNQIDELVSNEPKNKM